MKKLLFILTLTISATLSIAQTNETLSDAEIKKEWTETINWIKSKSSYYNIHVPGHLKGHNNQLFIYNNDDFHYKSTTVNNRWRVNPNSTEYKYYHVISGHRGSLMNVRYCHKIFDEDEDICRVDIVVENEEYYHDESWGTKQSFTLHVTNKDDMPKRLANAFNSLGKISSRYRKIINEEKRKKESDRIKSYGEKF